MILCSDTCSSAASDALRLCAKTVIPSLLPYLILSALISSSGASRLIGRLAQKPFSALFGISGSLCSAFFTGILSGYPAGAASVLQLYRAGECDSYDAEAALVFCNNTGPAFLIGGIGAGILGNSDLGVILYVSQLCSALICGIILRPHKHSKRISAPAPSAARQSMAEQLVNAVSSAGSNMLVICSFIVFFAVVGALLRELMFTLVITSNFIHALLLSFFELTSGVGAAAKAGSAAIPLCAFAVGWSGLSVHMQTMAILEGSGLSMKQYAKGKLIQAFLCPIISLLILKITV